VIIDDPGAAGYFLRVFDDDWTSVKGPPAITPDYLRIVIVMMVMILLVILYFRRRRV